MDPFPFFSFTSYSHITEGTQRKPFFFLFFRRKLLQAYSIFKEDLVFLISFQFHDEDGFFFGDMVVTTTTTLSR